MAAYGGSRASGTSTGDVTTIDTGNLNVTGSDLCLVAGAAESVSANPTISFIWDPAGNNEAMSVVTALSAGTYVDMSMAYLDDPTAANAPIRASFGTTVSDASVIATFATAAGNVVPTDNATNSFATTGSSLSATVPNVVSGDLVLDFAAFGETAAVSAGAGQTETGVDVTNGAYHATNMSYQAGADGGVMSWTCTGQSYGAGLIGLRIPNVAAGGGGGFKGLMLLGVGT